VKEGVKKERKRENSARQKGRNEERSKNERKTTQGKEHRKLNKYKRKMKKEKEILDPALHKHFSADGTSSLPYFILASLLRGDTQNSLGSCP
jgi:hypothetical protein